MTFSLSAFARDDTGDFLAILNGDKYQTSFRATGVADGNVAIDAFIKNPPNSGVLIFVVPIFNPGGLTDIDLAENVDLDSSGTAATVLNSRRGAADDHHATIDFNGTHTVNGDTINDILPGSQSQGANAATGARLSDEPNWLLNPGESLLWTLTNRTGGTARYGMSFTWTEIQL